VQRRFRAPTVAKYNYFEPKGSQGDTLRRHDRSMFSPIPNVYLLQDWIISFPDGTADIL